MQAKNGISTWVPLTTWTVMQPPRTSRDKLVWLCVYCRL